MNEIVHSHADLGDAEIHYVTSGSGEPLVLLHGWPATWYEWRDVIPHLADRYHVIAPDLRGLGDSSRPSTGYDKRTIADDVWRLVHDELGYDRFYLVGRSWGAVAAYPLAADHPDATRRLVMIGVAPPHDGYLYTGGWHHLFHQVPDLPLALIKNSEEEYLRWFHRNWAHPSYTISEEAVAEYMRTYSQADVWRASMEYYRAIPQDMTDNNHFARTLKLPMPVLAVEGEGPMRVQVDPQAEALMLTKSWEKKVSVADAMQELATDVSEVTLEETGYWIPEERPERLANIIAEFCRTTGPTSSVVGKGFDEGS